MKDVIENLKKLAEEYRNQLGEINHKISKLEDEPRAKALVGKYFKYSNSYGNGTRWWLYIRIAGVRKIEVIVDSFQEDPYGKIEIVYDKPDYIGHYYNDPNWVNISENEYNKRYKKLVDKLAKQIKRGKK